MAIKSEDADRFLNELEVKDTRTVHGSKHPTHQALPSGELIGQGNGSNDESSRNAFHEATVSTPNDSRHETHETLLGRSHTVSITDDRDSHAEITSRSVLSVDTEQKHPGRKRRRGRGRSRSRSPADGRRSHKERDWDHEWVHDLYRPRHEGGHEWDNDFYRPDHAGARRHRDLCASMASHYRPETEKAQADMYGACQPKKEDSERIENTSFDARGGFGAQNKLTELIDRERQVAKQRLFSDESRIQDACSGQKPKLGTDEQARLTYAELDRQTGEQRAFGVRPQVQGDSTGRSRTGTNTPSKSYHELETEVARLRLEASLTRKFVGKLERRTNLLRSINQRRKLWLAESDADIARQSEMIRMAVGFPAADRFGQQWQSRNISHNSILMNIKKELRAQIEELTTKTWQIVIELPNSRFDSDAAIGGCLPEMEKEKENIVRVMEGREVAKKQAFEDEMQMMQNLHYRPPSGPATTSFGKT